MPQTDPDMERLDTPEVLRCVWETLGELARKPESKNSSTWHKLDMDDSLLTLAFERCKSEDLIPGDVQRAVYPPFKHMVLKVYHSALSRGLILPTSLAADLSWNQDSGPFHFTSEGIKYFAEGSISIDDPDYLCEVLFELKQRVASIGDGQIELLLEAQRCIKSGCYRAGMVVMGVASEDSCIELMDAIPKGCQPPAAGSSLHSDWASCCNTSLAFTRRWKPSIRILEGIKRIIRPTGQGELWWPWWEMVPGSLHTLGEAVRISRNAAAHDIEREFSRAEVALLLSAMPTMLEMIASLTDFFQYPILNLPAIQI